MAVEDSAARFALIQENLAEVLNDEIIKKILDEGKHPKIYWGRFICGENFTRRSGSP